MPRKYPKKVQGIEHPDYIEKYGLRFMRKDGLNDLNIELNCYRNKVGLKPEVHFRNAFKILWPRFPWNEWMELMCWAWCNYRVVGVMGHSRAGKTFGHAHFALLDYLAAPPITATTLTTTKFDALKTRLWGDVMRAIESATNHNLIKEVFKITSTSNELSFKQRDKAAEEKFLIQGVATDNADKSAGKIRGQHADRRRIIVDEAQNVAEAIYLAFRNAMSAQDFIGVLLTNPVEKVSEFGRWMEPVNGYSSIHDSDLFWTTKAGICLHLDGLQSPNIKAGKTIYPFLLTQDYIDSVPKDTIEWWMFIRGYFPPDGMVAKIWPSNTIENARRVIEFDYPPTYCATLDPAFESDDCALIIFAEGRLRDGVHCAQAQKSYKISTKVGPDELPKDYQIAREVMRICREQNVAPENYIQDETGNARGVLAILRVEWSPKVQGIYYGGAATNRPMRLNDTKPANEQVLRFVSELWFRASFLAQAGMLCGLDKIHKNTVEDLAERRYTVKQVGDVKLMVAESKEEMKARLGRSPDWGDSYCQMGELMVRKGFVGELKKEGGMQSQYAVMRQRAREVAKRYDETKEFAWHS